MNNLYVGLGFMFTVIALCLPFVLFGGEPDIIDAIREAIKCGSS